MFNSLVIKNFRSLKNFEVQKLGRVNLIVGKNNSGKSSVLEALRIHAGNANRGLLENIASSHDEKFWLNDDEQSGNDDFFPCADFFTDRKIPNDENIKIVIGESEISESTLFIQHIFLVEREEIVTDEKGGTRQQRYRDIVFKLDSDIYDIPVFPAFSVSKGKQSFIIKFNRMRLGRPDYPTETFGVVPCSFIPTQFISMDELASEWDKIALTDYEKIVSDALKIIIPEFEGLKFVENEKPRSSSRESRRIAKVKLSNCSDVISLNSLGDGMLRVLQLSLKLFSAKSGFLLIDEFENGLHYSIQEKVWALLFEMAKRLDIQIFATTHSWDCIESFAKVANDNNETESVLFRMGKSVREKNRGQIIATVFDKTELYNITQADVEVR